MKTLTARQRSPAHHWHTCHNTKVAYTLRYWFIHSTLKSLAAKVIVKWTVNRVRQSISSSHVLNDVIILTTSKRNRENLFNPLLGCRRSLYLMESDKMIFFPSFIHFFHCYFVSSLPIFLPPCLLCGRSTLHFHMLSSAVCISFYTFYLDICNKG
jgi:hypothetical protein